MFKRCLNIAIIAHKGQTRKDKRPYITHPIRVSCQFTDEKLKCIAILHDVLEDCGEECITDIPDEIIDVVKLLTKSP